MRLASVKGIHTTRGCRQRRQAVPVVERRPSFQMQDFPRFKPVRLTSNLVRVPTDALRRVASVDLHAVGPLDVQLQRWPILKADTFDVRVPANQEGGVSVLKKPLQRLLLVGSTNQVKQRVRVEFFHRATAALLVQDRSHVRRLRGECANARVNPHRRLVAFAC